MLRMYFECIRNNRIPSLGWASSSVVITSVKITISCSAFHRSHFLILATSALTLYLMVLACLRSAKERQLGKRSLMLLFYRQVMARHDHLFTGQNDDSDEASIFTAAVVTSTRASLVPPTLLFIPRKKDHSINKTAVKKVWSEAGNRSKCDACKAVNRSCLLYSRGSGNDCLIIMMNSVMQIAKLMH